MKFPQKTAFIHKNLNIKIISIKCERLSAYAPIFIFIDDIFTLNVFYFKLPDVQLSKPKMYHTPLRLKTNIKYLIFF